MIGAVSGIPGLLMTVPAILCEFERTGQIVAARFKLNARFLERFCAILSDFSRIRHPWLEALAHGKQGSANAAFSCAEYGDDGVRHGMRITVL